MTTFLSDPTRTLRVMQVNPWQRFAEDWPRVTVEYRPIAGHRHAETYWQRGKPVRVVLDHKLSQVQRRCALAHELEHLDRGAPCESLRASIERRVVKATAKYLLPDLELLAGMLTVYDLRRAADELWVTFPILIDRLRGMSDRELEYVTERRHQEAVA